jgi:hypothetical protein
VAGCKRHKNQPLLNKTKLQVFAAQANGSTQLNSLPDPLVPKVVTQLVSSSNEASLGVAMPFLTYQTCTLLFSYAVLTGVTHTLQQ